MLSKPVLHVVVAVLVLALFWSPALTASSKDMPPHVPTPVAYSRDHSYKDLQKFGNQVRAYTLQLGYRRFVVGVKLIRNLTGITEAVPWDLSDYVVNAISKLGPQFVSYRECGVVATPTGSIIAPLPQSGANPPAVDFWVTDSLEAVTKVFKADSKNGANGTGGGGHTQFDMGANRNRVRTVTSVTVTFNLEGADKLSLPGASATYRIEITEVQKQRSFSIFIAGSGISHDSNVTTTENLDDAIFAVTAASLIECLGNALEVPYYLISSVFPPDPQLDKRVRDRMAQLTPRDLERNLKVWMVADGYPMALNALDHLTDHDRAIVEVEMYHRSSPFTREGYADFLLATWRGLKYETACERVERYLADSKRAADEEAQRKQEKEAAEAAAKQQKLLQQQQLEQQRLEQQRLEQQRLEQQRLLEKKCAAAAKPVSRRHRVAGRPRTAASPCVTPAASSAKP